MKWISLIGLLVCGSVNAQSVICERYGALPGEPQQTFDRRCPAGYKEVGQVGGSSRSGGLANTQQPLVDAITQNNERTREFVQQSTRPARSYSNAIPTRGTYESWNVVMQTPQGSLPAKLTANGDCSISFNSDGLGTAVVTNVVRTNDSIYFSVSVDAQGQTLYLNYAGLIENNTLTGEFSTDYGSFAMNGTRSTGTGAIPSKCLSADPSTSADKPQSNNQERASSLVEDLTNLSELHSQGVLTDEEFNAAKRRLLGL